MRIVVPSITSIGFLEHSWQEKLLELELDRLAAVGLFLTGLNSEQRQECYRRLQAIRAGHEFKIPFVHAVSSMSQGEYELLIEQFGTQYFNLHPAKHFPREHELSAELRQQILIENFSSDYMLSLADLDGYAGICLDLSHLEQSRLLYPRVYESNLRLAESVPVLANHISAVSSHRITAGREAGSYATHDCTAGSFEYLQALPESVIAELCAIEVENSLAIQQGLLPEIYRHLSTAPLRKVA